MSHQDRVFFSTFIGVLAGLVVLAVIFFVIASHVAPGEKAGRLSVDEQAVAERIKPVGEVTVGSAAQAAGAAARSGETIVTTVCAACHGSGAMGAPKIGDKAAWAPRIAQGEKVLIQAATNGIRAMPPKGTCADCSDAELKGAVEYLMSKAK